MMAQVIRQGLPTGIQNSVVSVGNLVIQTDSGDVSLDCR